MHLLKSKLPSDCEIALFGDNHEGLRAAYRAGVESVVDWACSAPRRYLIHMGDGIEARAVDHKFYIPQAVNPDQTLPGLQADSFTKQLQPAAKARRLLAALMGNHEYGLLRFDNLTQRICERLGIQYGGLACKLHIQDGKGVTRCKFYLTHATRNKLNSASKDPVQRKANMLASLKQSLQNKASDCQLMGCGHTHKLLCLAPTPLLTMTDDGKELKDGYTQAGARTGDYILPESRWYVNSGSFLRTNVVGQDTYGELYGFDPVDLGYAVVRLEGWQISDVRLVTL